MINPVMLEELAEQIEEDVYISKIQYAIQVFMLTEDVIFKRMAEEIVNNSYLDDYVKENVKIAINLLSQKYSNPYKRFLILDAIDALAFSDLFNMSLEQMQAEELIDLEIYHTAKELDKLIKRDFKHFYDIDILK